MIWTIVGISAASLTMFGFLPQAIKIIKTKSAKDVSVVTLWQFNIGVFFWSLYGIHLKDYILITANITSLFILIMTLALYYKYR